MPNDALAERIKEELSKKWPELLFRDGESGMIEVAVRETGELAWAMNLASVREWCQHDPANGMTRWLEDPQVNRMLALAAGKISQPEITRDSLCIRLSDRRRFENLEGEGPPPPHREVFDNVWGFIISFNEDWGARYLAEDDLTELGLDFDAAWDLALGEHRSRAPDHAATRRRRQAGQARLDRC